LRSSFIHLHISKKDFRFFPFSQAPFTSSPYYGHELRNPAGFPECGAGSPWYPLAVSVKQREAGLKAKLETAFKGLVEAGQSPEEAAKLLGIEIQGKSQP